MDYLLGQQHCYPEGKGTLAELYVWSILVRTIEIREAKGRRDGGQLFMSRVWEKETLIRLMKEKHCVCVWTD
jgi:hypothetical protein